MATYCMSCGAIRVGDALVCGTCGRAFDADTPAPVAPSPGGAGTARLIAGLAWLGCAALTTYLGFIQLGYVGSILDDRSVAGFGNGGLIAAAFALLFGVRILTTADRGFLGTSVAWAVVTVVLNGYQIANGATHWASIGATVAALVAGVMSYVARRSMAAPPRLPQSTTFGPGWELPPSAATPLASPAPVTPDAPSGRRATLWIADLLLLVAIGVAIAVGALVVFSP